MIYIKNDLFESVIAVDMCLVTGFHWLSFFHYFQVLAILYLLWNNICNKNVPNAAINNNRSHDKTVYEGETKIHRSKYSTCLPKELYSVV